jgi:hypothetical protein
MTVTPRPENLRAEVADLKRRLDDLERRLRNSLSSSQASGPDPIDFLGSDSLDGVTVEASLQTAGGFTDGLITTYTDDVLAEILARIDTGNAVHLARFRVDAGSNEIAAEAETTYVNFYILGATGTLMDAYDDGVDQEVGFFGSRAPQQPNGTSAIDTLIAFGLLAP